MMTGLRLRSALYLPATNARALEKARALPCDAVILDLEDAVAPEMKLEARQRALQAVQEGGFGHRHLVVRVNGIDTDWGEADLKAFSGSNVDAILVPKIGNARTVDVCSKLSAGKPLWAMIETPESVLNVREIAASSGLRVMVMGTNDLAKELRTKHRADRLQFVGFFMQTIASARLAGISVLDGVYNRIDDAEGFVAECRQASELGFDGKTLIHPGQIEPANKAFSPSDEELRLAREVVRVFELPANANTNAIRIEGQMFERLHYEALSRLLIETDKG